MKKFVSAFLFLSVSMLFGCYVNGEKASQSTQEQPKYIESLSWVQTANVAQEASAAIAKKDFRLWALAGRGQAIPGIAPDQKQVLMNRCGYKILPGSTDVVRDEQHLQLLQRVDEYAVKYNQLVAAACSQ